MDSETIAACCRIGLEADATQKANFEEFLTSLAHTYHVFWHGGSNGSPLLTNWTPPPKNLVSQPNCRAPQTGRGQLRSFIASTPSTSQHWPAPHGQASQNGRWRRTSSASTPNVSQHGPASPPPPPTLSSVPLPTPIGWTRGLLALPVAAQPFYIQVVQGNITRALPCKPVQPATMIGPATISGPAMISGVLQSASKSQGLKAF